MSDFSTALHRPLILRPNSHLKYLTLRRLKTRISLRDEPLHISFM